MHMYSWKDRNIVNLLCIECRRMIFESQFSYKIYTNHLIANTKHNKSLVKYEYNYVMSKQIWENQTQYDIIIYIYQYFGPTV